MDTQEKIKAILEAIASKKVSANQLEPSRRGATIAAIKHNKPVKPSTVDKLYASVQTILSCREHGLMHNKPMHKPHEPIQEPVQDKPMHEPQEPIQDKPMHEPVQETDSLSVRIGLMEKENADLKAMITGLISRVESLSQIQITKDNKDCDTDEILKDGDVIHENGIDFVIRLESQAVKIALVNGTEKRIEYQRYYAKKKIAGKLHRVYLGDIARRKESMEKIKAYCKRHGLNIDQPDLF